MSFEVAQPILNSPFAEPAKYWFIREGEMPQLIAGRRPALVFQPRDQREEWPFEDGVLRRLPNYERGYELLLVNFIRERVKAWRLAGYPGATRTTTDLLQHWTREDRAQRLFFAQVEAAETVIFLTEARSDFLQGIEVPREELTEESQAEGVTGFLRYACKMATGSGKSTVMAMLAAWSILNKVNDRADARFSDVVLIVTPNVTIRDRLRELNPDTGDASLFRTRDLVPARLMPMLTRGRILVTNWHVFQPQTPFSSGGARVVRAGVRVETTETLIVGEKTTTARGNRYVTLAALNAMTASGEVEIVEIVDQDEAGTPKKLRVRSVRYRESDAALVKRVLGRTVGGKQNILVMNDEAHHAYRIRRAEDSDDNSEDFADDDEAESFYDEATVWVDGLDRIHKERGINVCIDLSATPYYLGRVGQFAGKPFPWVVSDFGLIDAIESGLVKVPQLAYQDPSGEERAKYFNIWRWIMSVLTSAEKTGKKGQPKPEAVLKYSVTPIAMIGGNHAELSARWKDNGDDPRPPVFILVCKNTKIAATIFEWIADGKSPAGMPDAKLPLLRNGKENGTVTIRVDSKVVAETDTGAAKDDENRWMRLTLDTVGKREWPKDSQGRAIYPEGFADLATKLDKPLHPPGRDVRCIVSVGMLTEGWDANTVTHIIGIRPFMSQLLCEQVVGRGLRRLSYEPDPETGLLREEVAQVLGVPFEIVPFKATTGAPPLPPVKRFHVHALPERDHLEIRYPIVEGYTQAIRHSLKVEWSSVAKLVLDPIKYPPEVLMKGLAVGADGRPTLSGPGKVSEMSLDLYREQTRPQQVVFELARDLTRDYLANAGTRAPAHVLFPQVQRIVARYLEEYVEARHPYQPVDALLLPPFYGRARETLIQAIHPDSAKGEAHEVPRYARGDGTGSTSHVDFWTSKDVRATQRSHVNYVVADTKSWEQSAAYRIDKHAKVRSWVKNAGLGFAIPYTHEGQSHDYYPDFVIRVECAEERYLILEIKGYDEVAEVKRQAAERWCRAVNADGQHGRWMYVLARNPDTEVAQALSLADLDG